MNRPILSILALQVRAWSPCGRAAVSARQVGSKVLKEEGRAAGKVDVCQGW
jgi:hypothetical protein